MQTKRMLIMILMCLSVVSCVKLQEKVSTSPTNTNIPSTTFATEFKSTQPPPAFTKAPVVLMEERQLNSYTIHVWRDMSYGLDTVVIEKDGQIKFTSDPWAWVKTLDVNNDTEPEIVVWQYSGGNHGKFQIQVFMTDDSFSKILETPSSMCEGEFKDLNDDGTLEYRTCDDAFVYYNWRCSFATSPFVNAVYEYGEGDKYQLANLEFSKVYDEAIAVHSERIQDFHPLTSWSQEILHDETQCTVLPLVLDYLYSGQRDKAWDILKSYYPFPDLNNFESDILQKAQSSPFFVEP